MTSRFVSLVPRFVSLVDCAAAFALVLGGCDGGGSSPDAGPSDDGSAPPVDARVFDASNPDAARADGSAPDADQREGGAAPDAAPAIALCHPVPAMPDADLARRALAILGSSAAGASEERCAECHTLTRARLRHWRALGDAARRDCIGDGTVADDATAARILDCLEDPEAMEITPARLGIYSAAASLEWFRSVFERAAGGGDGAAAHAAFVASAGMPPARASSGPLTQGEFDVVCAWFERGLPELEAVIPADPRTDECLPGVSSDVLAHVEAMATTGWAARNASAGMLMHGCAGAARPEDCLASAALASTTSFGAGWEDVGAAGVPGARLRVLYTTSYATAWWTRSSPDGRFVAHGAASAPNLRIIDLAAARVIGGSADYDPDFFPDGSGFMVQGERSGARVCEQRVLTTGMPTMLTFGEPGCSGAPGVGLYEHVGASLDGGDYWAISSNGAGSEYDNGGQTVTRSDPAADYTSAAAVTFTFFTNDGSGFVRTGALTVTTPYEGDHVLSPSLRMLLGRIAGPGDVPLGYVLRRIEVRGSGAERTIALPEVARYCIAGGKPAFSYDERWMAIHHYIGDGDAVALGFSGPSDPGFAAYRTRGGANVYLVDLTSGASYRITNMGPGQYALFPHFRSDGWLHMVVRTEGEVPEHIVASDAALRLR